MEKQTLEKPIIYVVATPIGNLEDISLRASRVLSECDLIAAEDTRVSSKLLAHLGIKHKILISYHDKTEQKKAEPLLDKLEEECLSLALVSDAGTPLISDPGYHLIRLAHKRKIRVVPIPGASSFTSLVSSSGLPSTKLFFTGFLPKKETQRKEEIQNWQKLGASIVFFESALRLTKSLEIIIDYYPNSEICVGKELTKYYETIFTAPCKEVLEYVKNELNLKGEFAIMVSFSEEKKILSEEEKETLVAKTLDEHPNARTKDLAAMLTTNGLSSKEAYDFILKAKAKK